MRLRVPTAQHIKSNDGSCSLSYVGASGGSYQAGGGGIYLLRVKRFWRVTEICGVVQSTTSFGFEQQAKAEGLNINGMGLVESGRHLDDYLQKHGHTSTVIDFYYADEHRDAHHRPIKNLDEYADKFCKLLLQLKSCFQFNNSEYPECGEGHYPDAMSFHLVGTDRKLTKHFTADEAFNSL